MPKFLIVGVLALGVALSGCGGGGGGSSASPNPPPPSGDFIPLGDLAGGDFRSSATGVSDDGTVVVGVSQADDVNQTREAFIWTQAAGMQSLRELLIANGAQGLDTWALREARGISADGRWVVGYGINPSGFEEGFLANISLP
jgi:probable HAF family extracellular repeat protein